MLLGSAVVATGSETRTGVDSRPSGTVRRALEEHAFNALYARIARPLSAYLRRLTSGDEAASDLVQESFLRILRADLPEMSDRELDAYVYKTASRLARDRWRHRQVDRRWRERLPSVSEAGFDSGADAALDMDRILSRLRPRDRAIVWLAYVEGRSHKEIGSILGLRPASVRVILFRARRKLAGLLEAEGLAPEVAP